MAHEPFSILADCFFTGAIDGSNAVYVAGGWEGAVGSNSPLTAGHVVAGVLCYWGSSDPITKKPTPEGLRVWVNGVLQTAGDDYTVADAVSMGATGLAAGQLAVGYPITFNQAPHSGDVLRFEYVIYWGVGGWA